MKVLVATEKPFAKVAVDGIREVVEQAGYEMVLLEKYTAKQQLLDAVADADALIIRSDNVDAEVLDAAKQLKIVVRAGAGYDNIDLAAATAHGVVAMNTPGQNSNAVAELALGMMVMAVRNMYNGTSGTELKDKKLGIHAYGNVGRNVARIAKGFGMQIYAFDAYCPDEVMLKEGVTPDGASLTVTNLTATVAQYGFYVSLSDVLQLTSIDNTLVETTKLLGSQAGMTLDTVTREVINGGTNVMYSGGKSARAALDADSKLSVNDVAKIIMVGGSTRIPMVLDKVEKFMIDAALECGATIVQKCFHLFTPHGVSGVIIISESHLAIHTWPEFGYAAVDLFTCGEQCDPKISYEFLKRKFNSRDAKYTQLNRGLMDADQVEHKSFLISENF